MNKMSIFSALLLLSAAFAAPAAEPLVDAAWTAGNSCNDSVVVLDVRNRLGNSSRADYEKAHIPCAVHTDYLKDGWRSKVDGVIGQLPPTADLEKLIGGLGIGNDSHVVIVAGGASSLAMGTATRVYWTFKVLGHDNVSILDGGMAAYEADKANKPESGSNTLTAKTFKANLRQDMLLGKADVKEAMENKSATIIDHRPADMFAGINRHGKAKRHGTIPGSANVPERWITENGGGRFRSPDVLAQLYATAGVPADGAEINFCNTGHWASLGWFVSHELLGNDKAKLYDGSMVEWSADETLPIEVKVPLQ